MSLPCSQYPFSLLELGPSGTANPVIPEPTRQLIPFLMKVDMSFSGVVRICVLRRRAELALP